jgi:GT2 family glycosyltransferase
MEIELSVIIANYNGIEYLQKCLNSVYNLNFPLEKIEIIVVDYGTQKELLDSIQKKFPKVKVILNEINNYCKANNIGIENSRGKYLLFLNNDAELDSEYINSILTYFKRDEKIMGATGKILFQDGRIQSTGHISLPDFYWGDRGFRELDEGQYDEVEEIESIPNTAAVYKREIFEKRGKFDEDFVMFLEDVDFCYRLRKAGYKVLYVPEAKCWHIFHGSAENGLVNYYVERNRLLFIAKHHPHKVAEKLMGGNYSTLGGSKLGLDRLIEILSDVMLKIYLTHGRDIFEKSMKEVKKNIKNIVNYMKYQGVQRLEEERNQYKKELEKVKNEINSLVLKLEEEIEKNKQMQEQIKVLKGELSKVEEEKALFAKVVKEREKEREKAVEELSGYKEELFKLREERGILKGRLEEMTKEKEKVEGELKRDREELSKTKEEKDILKGRLEEMAREKEKIEMELNRYEEELSQLREERRFLASSLAEKEKIIESLGKEKETLDLRWQEFYHSQTYRFFVRPLWRILDFLKECVGYGRPKIAIIKPYVIKLDEFNQAVYLIRKKEGDCRVFAFISCESSQAKDCKKCWAERKLLFLRDKKPQVLFAFLRFIFYSLTQKFRKVYILESYHIPRGYRKARLLGALLSTSEARIYYIYQARDIKQPNLAVMGFNFVFARLSLYAIVMFFTLLILPWIKLKKISKR